MTTAVSPEDDARTHYRILSIDGGGIQGVFPAAFLARLEEKIGQPIARYFDLIAGTSTGGIIAIGLGLGIPAEQILRLYVEKGPRIFGQHHGPFRNKVERVLRFARSLLRAKYESTELHSAVSEVLGNRKLGESTTRLIIPAWHSETQRVYVYKTAHHARFESDCQRPALDAAMATAAAPTYLAPHLTQDEVQLVDGGVWANNPIGVATVEAIGVLGWPADKLRILSLGTISEVYAPPDGTGISAHLRSLYLIKLFLAGQSHSALGTAKLLTGDVHYRKAIWRVDQQAPTGRFHLDNVARIGEMKDRAFAEARDRLPELRQHFFHQPADEFVPFYRVEAP